ncbi:hypothetical protein [Anabaena sp. 4-3]|uniref:hypothetical protein n=1 Tax=Anabaena sp. 4-3 TaxID=1811979 RepID=UPI0012E8C750|nr:hypothetical protein [Anabaena sp. 4-3]
MVQDISYQCASCVSSDEVSKCAPQYALIQLSDALKCFFPENQRLSSIPEKRQKRFFYLILLRGVAIDALDSAL